MKSIPWLTFGFLGWLASLVVSHAFIVNPPYVPVDRLVSSAQKIIAQHPEADEAHYTLGRIHYVAFSYAANMLQVSLPRDDRLPSVDLGPVDWNSADELASARRGHAYEMALHDVGVEGQYVPAERQKAYSKALKKRQKQLERSQWVPATGGKESEMLVHASAALEELQTAIKLKQGNSLYYLTLASFEEQFSDWKRIRKPARLSAKLKAVSADGAQEYYLKAFRASFTGDSGMSHLPSYSDKRQLLSYEAGRAFVRLAVQQPKSEQTDALAEVKTGLAKLDQLPPDPDDEKAIELISPMIFSLNPVTRIEELLAPGTQVDFDLRGYGPRQRWPWVKPQTGFLVWDPVRSGSISSAQQLFGSYTFQIFRATGYDALAALDDDGDGFLRGEELRGIRAWFDANGDGHCEPKEMRDLGELGIVAIAVRAMGLDDVHPTNPKGLLFSDGRALPTWDWMVKPAINNFNDWLAR